MNNIIGSKGPKEEATTPEKVDAILNDPQQSSATESREQRRSSPVKMEISNDSKVQEHFEHVLAHVLAGSGTMTLVRQEGDRFPGQPSIIVEAEGMKLFLEFDYDNNLSKAELSISELDDTGKPKQYANGGDIYTTNPDTIGKYLSEVQAASSAEHSQPDEQNRWDLAESIVAISEAIQN